MVGDKICHIRKRKKSVYFRETTLFITLQQFQHTPHGGKKQYKKIRDRLSPKKCKIEDVMTLPYNAEEVMELPTHLMVPGVPFKHRGVWGVWVEGTSAIGHKRH